MMQDIILSPKWAKNKKPIKKRKPSKPLDGINHRLIAEQKAKEEAQQVQQVQQPQEDQVDDNAPPSRIELVAKATELGLKFTKRTSDEKLLELVTTALQGN